MTNNYRESDPNYLTKTLLPSINMSLTSEIMSCVISWFRIVSTASDSLNEINHKHKIYELHFICTGSLHFRINNKDYILTERQFIIVPPKTNHSIQQTKGFTQKMVIAFAISSQVEKINRVFNKKDLIIGEASETIVSLANSLVLKAHEKQLFESMSTLYTVQGFLLEIVDLVSARDNHQDNNTLTDTQRSDQIISFIQAHAFQNIGVEDIAHNLNISDRQLNRNCQKYFKCTAGALIINQRLQLVKRLLKNTNYSLTDISEMAGFSNVYAFIRHFHHYVGKTPGEYRREQRLEMAKEPISAKNKL